MEKLKSESDIVSQIVSANALTSNLEVMKEITKYGDVPIIYLPPKSVRKSKKQTPGLGNLIENAMNVQEVTNLLNNGKINYKCAQPKTIRKWEIIAKKRIEELS